MVSADEAPPPAFTTIIDGDIAIDVSGCYLGSSVLDSTTESMKVTDSPESGEHTSNPVSGPRSS